MTKKKDERFDRGLASFAAVKQGPYRCAEDEGHWRTIDDKPILKERDGRVIVDMFVHQHGDCQAGPSKRVIARYDFLDLPPDEVAFPRPIPE